MIEAAEHGIANRGIGGDGTRRDRQAASSAACVPEGRLELHDDSDQATDWQRAHEQLVRLARTRAGLDFEEGRWLVVALRGGTHVRLGFGSFAEYVERLFSYAPRLTHDKLRVAEALEDLPSMAQALRKGETSWSALRELTRVATPETEGDWLAAARSRTVREVERLVSGRRPGSRPEDQSEAEVRRHVIRLEVSGEVLATFRDAMAKLRRDAGEPLDDDAAILLMARHVLQGPADTGRASYQVALTVCESCQRGLQQGRGELIEVGADVVAMANCDAQRIGETHVGDDGSGGERSISDARWGSAPSGRGANAKVESNRAAADVNAHVRGSQPTSRATQDLPPAVRRAVLRRDGGRCVFPGCRHATFVDVHHIQPRAEKGRHEPDNLITLCAAHHRAVHQGRVSVEGRVGKGLRFQHADGTVYGAASSPSAVDSRASAFQALRRMGFGESEVRRALAQVGAHVGDSATVDVIVRRCLLDLTKGVVARAS